ncbi:MAG: CDP-glycerol glycerophosphotransferase family protein [Clostridia bacterium]|nr:CDP-glycerol glycerophosphotransferase family protein [Clostridia bacterium]
MANLKEFVKSGMFSLYSFFFNIGAMMGVKEDRVGLVSMHNAHFNDGLGEVEAELKYRATKGGPQYEFLHIERTALDDIKTALWFVTVDALKLGRAKYIFLNDNFMPLAKCRPNADTVITQLWHGQGAFKKFGFDIKVPEKVRRREVLANRKLTYVACSSTCVRDIYARAFGVPQSSVLAVGSPNSDYYFRRREREVAKANLYELYPELEGKYVILYAPTFREDADADEHILDKFDAKALREALGDDVEILIRLHPQVHASIGDRSLGAFDVTDYDNVNELCLIADMLITDYSSICMDFAIQNKPIAFYAYDLDSYKGARDFYFNYEEYVPGPVASDMASLISAVKALKAEPQSMDAFRRFNFDEPDGDATSRLLDIVMKN